MIQNVKPMNKKYLFFLAFIASLLLGTALQACSDDDPQVPEVPEEPTPDPAPETPAMEWTDLVAAPDEWDGQKRADITYQLLVYSFADSDGDKWGDLKGITDKLDYLDRLGVSALWLSPIHPAMSYHGYDVTDYTAVNPQYGTMNDFDRLVSEAEKRGIRIYLDYVMNHTGKEHPWFVDAKSSADSPYRDYYIFSTDPQTDIAEGKIPMIAREGSNGYNASEWFQVSDETSAVAGVLKFVLDWSNASSPLVTVSKGTTVDPDNNDTDATDAKYLYYGDGICKQFYAKGDGIYELTVDFNSTWGFLIRTSNDPNWPSGTKYGASSSADKVTTDEAFRLTNANDPANITFDSQQIDYYHSHFQTDWFADLNYGPVEQAASSPAYQELVEAAKGWVDRGVAGLRLDAVKHIYHNATSDENPRFLKMFYDDMNAYYKQQGHADDFYMVGEVLSEHNEVAPYYAGLPALFEFSFWYRLEWAINNATGCYFAKDITGYRDEYAGRRADYIAATKLSNHDEDRAASKLGKSADKCRLAAAMLLTSSGEPYIYYGEELGMYGMKDKGDEYVRGPMLWGDNSTTDYTDKVDVDVPRQVASVTAQQEDAGSLLHTYLTFTQLRNTYPSLAEGTMTKHPVYNDSREKDYKSIAAWYMTKDSEKMLVIHNLASSEVQFPLTESIEKAVAVQGTVQQQPTDTYPILKMGGYSSVVLKLP